MIIRWATENDLSAQYDLATPFLDKASGEDLEVGGLYAEQLPTIAIAFTNGAVKSLEEKEGVKKDKIHRLCKIMDCEDNTVFTNAMELHYINMKAFAEAVNKANSISIEDTEEIMFAKWLSVITQKEINNKDIIENACSEEEIFMAVSALARQSEDMAFAYSGEPSRDTTSMFGNVLNQSATSLLSRVSIMSTISPVSMFIMTVPQV